ncbi:MAG: hypothetical protein WCJ56_14525, partial [bacterium]
MLGGAGIGDPTSRFLTADGAATSDSTLPNVAYLISDLDFARHDGKFIVSFLDGHTDIIKASAVPAYLPASLTAPTVTAFNALTPTPMTIVKGADTLLDAGTPQPWTVDAVNEGTSRFLFVSESGGVTAGAVTVQVTASTLEIIAPATIPANSAASFTVNDNGVAVTGSFSTLIPRIINKKQVIHAA